MELQAWVWLPVLSPMIQLDVRSLYLRNGASRLVLCIELPRCPECLVHGSIELVMGLEQGEIRGHRVVVLSQGPIRMQTTSGQDVLAGLDDLLALPIGQSR